MPSEPFSEVKFEIGHVPFIDIVPYFTLSINEHRAAIDELTLAVGTSEQFQNEEVAGRLINIPTSASRSGQACP